MIDLIAVMGRRIRTYWRKSCTTLDRCLLSAASKAVRPLSETNVGSAPLENRYATASSLPCSAAVNRTIPASPTPQSSQKRGPSRNRMLSIGQPKLSRSSTISRLSSTFLYPGNGGLPFFCTAKWRSCPCWIPLLRLSNSLIVGIEACIIATDTAVTSNPPFASAAAPSSNSQRVKCLSYTNVLITISRVICSCPHVFTRDAETSNLRFVG